MFAAKDLSADRAFDTSMALPLGSSMFQTGSFLENRFAKKNGKYGILVQPYYQYHRILR